MSSRTAHASIALLASLVSPLVACRGDGGDPGRPRTVVFVCEHGSAKSVVAAALFNAVASARKLRFRAEPRGLVPDPTVLPAAAAGLRSDGLAPGREKPVGISRADVDRAALVVAFDPLPPALAANAPVMLWDGIPPVSVDYAASRDAMRARIDALLDELAGERPAR